MIVGIENRDGNTNVRFNQKETLERIFKRLEASEIYISRARMDCGSCSEEIVDMVEAHCRHFYIRANRCSSFYDSMFALTGWKTVEINGIEFELNSILVEKWKGKPYRLVIQRQRRIEGGLDICACIIPSANISEENLKTIKEYTKKIAEEMHVRGLMNMQYAIEDGKVYVLEANPRASRTVPLVSKVCNISMVPLATQIITSEFTGAPSPLGELKEREIPHYGVKEAVFPFNMFPEVDPLLGPEMRSTGEVLGLAKTVGEAFYKAQEATKSKLPLEGTVLISVSDRDKVSRGSGASI